MTAAAGLLVPCVACGAQSSSLRIDAAEVGRHVAVLAADSMRGRAARTEDLFRAARYVAGELEASGVEPLDTTYVRTFSMEVRQLIPGGVRAGLDGEPLPFRYGADYAALYGSRPRGEGELVVLRPEELGAGDAAARVAGRVLLVPVSEGSHGGERGAALRVARAAGAAGLILGHRSEGAGEEVASRRARYEGALAFNDSGDLVPTLYAGPGLTSALMAAADHGRARVSLEVPWRVVDPGRTPNVAGVIRGTDPQLRDEWVLLVAHLDHLGVRRGGADSIYNGADDNASGVAALLEVAEELAAERADLRRSVVVLLTGGEEHGLRGAERFAAAPGFDRSRVAAVVNLDMIGRNDPGEIGVVGKDLSDLGARVEGLLAGHPEIGLRAVAREDEGLFRRSDHYVFAREGIPALWLFSGFHDDYHEPGDESGPLDEEKVARVATLTLLLTRSLATDEARPALTAAGRAVRE